MNIINATIQELCQAGKTPSEFCTNVKTCVSRALKRLKDTSSNLPKVQNTSSRRERTKNSSKTKKKFRRNLKRSIRKLSSEAGVRYGTMQNVLKNYVSNHTRKLNVKTLKVQLRSFWDKMLPEIIRAACSQVHDKL